MIPGAPAADAPVKGPDGDWLLDSIGGDFVLLAFGAPTVPAADVAALADGAIRCRVVEIGSQAGPHTVVDTHGLASQRYDARPGTVVLLRPDQHVCARWRVFDLPSVRAAIARATCND
jgi:3-(3-hydroxy-phenyl)propionate hydroxylase